MFFFLFFSATFPQAENEEQATESTEMRTQEILNIPFNLHVFGGSQELFI